MNEPDESLLIERLSRPDADDLAAIVALESDSFTNPWTPDALAEMIRVGRHAALCRAPATSTAWSPFCACWLIGPELHINTLAVKRAHRRQGIATRLVRWVLQETAAPQATLEVRRSNLAALKLYEKLGFRATAVREGYYRNPDEDGLILWLNP